MADTPNLPLNPYAISTRRNGRTSIRNLRARRFPGRLELRRHADQRARPADRHAAGHDPQPTPAARRKRRPRRGHRRATISYDDGPRRSSATLSAQQSGASAAKMQAMFDRAVADLSDGQTNPTMRPRSMASTAARASGRPSRAAGGRRGRHAAGTAQHRKLASHARQPWPGDDARRDRAASAELERAAARRAAKLPRQLEPQAERARLGLHAKFQHHLARLTGAEGELSHGGHLGPSCGGGRSA